MDASLGKKSRKLLWAAVLFALLMPLLLWYELENYHSHYGTGMASSFFTFIGILINGYTLFKNIRSAVKKEPASLAEIICALLSLIVCILVYNDAHKIPLCVECDHLTTEDLGYLSRWISGMDMP